MAAADLLDRPPEDTMQNLQFLEVILLALLAGFIAFRLYSVLGRRTGHERTREDSLGLPDRARPKAAPAAPETVAKLPDRGAAPATATASPLQRALLDIKLADRTFDPDKFLAGARTAHEIIVTAFAHGDRNALHPLLSSDVFAAFEQAIEAREAKKERVDFTFLSLKSARITGAELKSRTAEVTVTFESEVMLAGYDPSGALIEGDAKTPHSVTDVWTFARDSNAGDPNWMLIATESGA